MRALYCSILLLATLGISFSGLTNTTSKPAFSAQQIIDLSASQQAEYIASGLLSSEQILKTYLSRIEKMDRAGPRIQAMISLNPNALQEAQQKDNEQKNGNIKGVLHGVIVIVKDNIETSELPTTAGSLALKDNATKRDAPIIKRLKDAGAIILGKSNLSEWANIRDNDSISGWSAIGGQTRNPHSLDRTPCGSSSGSGAAIAAQFAPLAIGTETNGSIICPAVMNGIVGVKPTVGLLSRRHIVPISTTQDTAGPMTRNVKDAALMLSVMAGSDDQDSVTKYADDHKQDYTAQLNKSISGLKIGVLRSQQSKHPEIIASFNQALAELEKQGAVLIDIDKVDRPKDFSPKSLEVLLIELKHELNAYLADSAEAVSTRSLQEVIEFNNANTRELSLFKQSLFVDAQKTKGYDQHYKELIEYLRNATRINGINKLLSENQVDLLVSPTQTPAFLIDPVYGDSFPGGFAGLGWMAAIGGFPHVSVPMGDMRGLPIGISFIGDMYSESLLLNVAYKYEQATQKIIKPEFAHGALEHSAFSDLMSPLQ